MDKAHRYAVRGRHTVVEAQGKVYLNGNHMVHMAFDTAVDIAESREATDNALVALGRPPLPKDLDAWLPPPAFYWTLAAIVLAVFGAGFVRGICG